MATALTPNHYPRQWEDGAADKTALYALRGVTTGDTVDVGGDFMTVKQAIVLSTTTPLAFTAAIAGAVLTMPAGLSADAGYLLVWGVSS